MNTTGDSSRDENSLPAPMPALFACYRESIPDREPGSDFTPGLWTKIEARRGLTYRFGRVARGFVTAAAALSLVMAAGFMAPVANNSGTGSSYVDVLAQDTSDEADEVLIAASENL